jgi:hypothetical protein
VSAHCYIKFSISRRVVTVEGHSREQGVVEAGG